MSIIKDLIEDPKWRYYPCCTIYKVVDGDTFKARIDLGFGTSTKVTLRSARIDTPEIFRPSSEEERVLGYEAKAFVQEKVLDKPVGLLTCLSKHLEDKKGKYGRYLAIVVIPTEDKPLYALMEDAGLRKEDV